MTRLPEGYREVVLLHDLSGYTHQEIANMLEIQPGTSKSQLKRGRARLRELLTTTGTRRTGRDESRPEARFGSRGPGLPAQVSDKQGVVVGAAGYRSILWFSG